MGTDIRGWVEVNEALRAHRRAQWLERTQLGGIWEDTTQLVFTDPLGSALPVHSAGDWIPTHVSARGWASPLPIPVRGPYGIGSAVSAHVRKHPQTRWNCGVPDHIYPTVYAATHLCSCH
jgi:hypothetical protein